VIAYIDTSVVLRIVLDQPDPLREWNELQHGISNVLLRIECFRTLDRMWQTGEVTEDDLGNKRSEVDAMLRNIGIVPLDERVLKIAEQPFPTVISTLDALHLAAAMIYREKQLKAEQPIIMATHDGALARAARAMNFAVLGA
jgi:predicted nucleic acid-binding protein